MGATAEEREAALRNLKWDPNKSSLDEFLFQFRVTVKAADCDPTRQLALFMMAVPLTMYSVLNTATTIDEAMASTKKAVGMGLMAPVDKTALATTLATTAMN